MTSTWVATQGGSSHSHTLFIGGWDNEVVNTIWKIFEPFISGEKMIVRVDDINSGLFEIASLNPLILIRNAADRVKGSGTTTMSIIEQEWSVPNIPWPGLLLHQSVLSD